MEKGYCGVVSCATELLSEHSILLAEELNDRILLPSDPSGQGCDEDLPRLKDDCHPGIVAFGQRIGQLSDTSSTQLFFPGFC